MKKSMMGKDEKICEIFLGKSCGDAMSGLHWDHSESLVRVCLPLGQSVVRVREELFNHRGESQKFLLRWDQPALPVLLGIVQCMWDGMRVANQGLGRGVAAEE